MEKLVVNGGKKLVGRIGVSGSKNVATKLLVASLLTPEEVIIENVPRISDFETILEIVKDLGVDISFVDHTVKVRARRITDYEIPLEAGARVRPSSMLIAPLLVRTGKALIPNPGGCRIGARPIDRTVEGLTHMGASVRYVSEDGYFHAQGNLLKGTTYTFDKNTHTGTETLLIAAVLARGRTVLKNAAEEPEVDDLIAFLTSMGASIKRNGRTIVIYGVTRLTGTRFKVMPDRNEAVTFAIAAMVTGGDITVVNVKQEHIAEFLEKLEAAGGNWRKVDGGIRFYDRELKAVDVETQPHPGFMTDWQGPWAVLMAQARGVSTIHETVYENRFGYVSELLKMGADIDLFNPKVDSPKEFYNFNVEDDKEEYFHAARIHGPTKLHNAVVSISDLRAGATLVLAALAAKGKSVIYGIEHLDRGYERFEEGLRSLGADIKRVHHE